MFIESEHPRAKDGKFTDGNRNSLAEAEIIYNSEPVQPSTSKAPKLTKQEWAMFYERVGKIKKERHFVSKTKNGDMIIPIETEDSNVLVVASGSYATPKVKLISRFKNKIDMYDTIEVLEEYERK